MLKKLLFLLTIISSLNVSAQNVVINEICSRNYKCFEDETEKFRDWVEFYNDGSSAVDLGGMYLTDNLNNLTKFQIPTNDPSETTIDPDEYLIFFFDDETYKGPRHVSFKLNNFGESIALVASDGITIIDSVIFGALYYDVTYGRTSDGSSSWSFFPDPTPEDNNTGGGFFGITGKPHFSIDAGFYSSSIQVEINYPDSTAEVYYTLNGDEPSPSNGILYTGAIQIDTVAVLRARAYKDDYLPGEMTTKSYFINRTIDLPVLSVITDPHNLWDEDDGIYCFGDNYDPSYPYTGANFWSDEKVPGHIEFFQSNGAEVVSQNVNISISGNTSRGYAQKSMNFEAKDALGQNSIPWQLLPQLPIYNYKSFKIRNGGADWSSTGIRDALNHTLLEGEMDVDHQSNTPVILYLNGEYWGVMNLTEKLDEDYLKAHYPSINKDSLDILYSNAEVRRGDADNYNAMIDFIDNNSLSQQSNYEYIKDQIEIPSFINYFQSRIYYASTDWPFKNIMYWRPKDLSKKWRWVMWDTDRSTLLTTDPSRRCSYHDNTLHWATNAGAVDDWAQFLLNSLLENDEFRSQFITQFAHHINFSFCPIRVDSVLNFFRARLANELPAHIQRWSHTNDAVDYYTVGYYQSLAEWNTEVDTIKLFFDNRPEYVREHIMDQFDIDDEYELSLVKHPPHGGVLFVDTFKVPENACDLIYFEGYPVTLIAVPKPGYFFSGWTSGSGDTLPLTWTPDGDTTINAYFLPIPTQPSLASSNFSFTISNCDRVRLNWSNGNGQSRMVVAKLASAVNRFPIDHQAYLSDSIFGNGADLGNSNFVVYTGTDSSCVISGIVPGVNYYFAIIEFNSLSGYNNYNTSNYLANQVMLSIPVITLGNDITLCAENSTVLNAGIGLSTYIWNTGETSQSISIDSTGSGIGTFVFHVTGTNTEGCSDSDSINVTFDICTGISKSGTVSFEPISLFPNPFYNRIYIYPSAEIYTITIFNAIGKIVFSKIVDSGELMIDDHLVEGIYFVRVETREQVKVFKLVKSGSKE